MPRSKKPKAFPFDEFDEVFETAHLAKKLEVSPRTLEGWRINGCGPAYVKMGKRVLYRKSAILRWLNERTKSHTGEVR